VARRVGRLSAEKGFISLKRVAVTFGLRKDCKMDLRRYIISGRSPIFYTEAVKKTLSFILKPANLTGLYLLRSTARTT